MLEQMKDAGNFTLPLPSYIKINGAQSLCIKEQYSEAVALISIALWTRLVFALEPSDSRHPSRHFCSGLSSGDKL